MGHPSPHRGQWRNASSGRARPGASEVQGVRAPDRRVAAAVRRGPVHGGGDRDRSRAAARLRAPAPGPFLTVAVDAGKPARHEVDARLPARRAPPAGEGQRRGNLSLVPPADARPGPQLRVFRTRGAATGGGPRPGHLHRETLEKDDDHAQVDDVRYGTDPRARRLAGPRPSRPRSRTRSRPTSWARRCRARRAPAPCRPRST